MKQEKELQRKTCGSH